MLIAKDYGVVQEQLSNFAERLQKSITMSLTSV